MRGYFAINPKLFAIHVEHHTSLNIYARCSASLRAKSLLASRMRLS